LAGTQPSVAVGRPQLVEDAVEDAGDDREDRIDTPGLESVGDRIDRIRVDLVAENQLGSSARALSTSNGRQRPGG
jgi:hypothetical protein